MILTKILQLCIKWKIILSKSYIIGVIIVGKDLVNIENLFDEVADKYAEALQKL